jgi:hypothetical protein
VDKQLKKYEKRATKRTRMGYSPGFLAYPYRVKETKEAPPGTYFTKTGNLVKGRLTKAAREKGARETDPKDSQRSKVPPVTQRNEGKKWSKKYKKSINCNNPKGFSQKAHCAGRKKK